MKGIVILCLLLTSGLVNAEVYKWVDDKGEVHYEDHPKGETAKISIDADSAAKVSEPETEKAKTQKLIDAMEKSRKEQAKARKKQLAEQHKQDEKCMKEKNKTRKLEARMQKKYSEFSNDRPDSYNRLEAELADRKKYIAEYCK